MHPPSPLVFSLLLLTTIPLLTLASTIPPPSPLLSPRSTLNGPCTGSSSLPGICIPTASCTSTGGTFISDACPGTPPDIKCCTKTNCGSSSHGTCKFADSCASGNTERNFCPGPAEFRCCLPEAGRGDGFQLVSSTTTTDGTAKGQAGGTGKQPDLPTTAEGCKEVAIQGAKTIIQAFPGQVEQIGCTRQCGADTSSDHCRGMATDLMVNLKGQKVTTGQPIAEWAMHHASDLRLSYVMWGQRIWDADRRDDTVKPWDQWRYQSCLSSKPDCVRGDRGDNTQNHWDHVHVSYK